GAVLYIGRRLLVQQERLLDEAAASRASMDAARKAFLGNSTGQLTKLLVLLVLPLFVLAGCASIDEANLKADVATFNAVAPVHADYLRKDSALDAEGLEFELNTLVLWRARLIRLGGEPAAVNLDPPGENDNGRIEPTRDQPNE
ncbi:MAG: hypothetical protein KDB07_12145, partial [Planctomycetes bacterium]|nr:hypothetical protein [Planctomycetota bacterium]